MLLKSSIIILAFTLALTGCSKNDEHEKKEFESLETGINSIAVGQETGWLDRLDELKKMNFESKRIRDIQSKCISAYEKYADALVRLEESRKRIEKLQASAKTIEALDDLKKQQAGARKSIESTNMLLNESENLVDECLKLRNLMKKEFGLAL